MATLTCLRSAPRLSRTFTPTLIHTRRAMMSAWRNPESSTPTASTSQTHHDPPLHDSPPVVVPNSKTPLNPDAASPQTAARPPPAPKAERPKPQIRARKAALSIVRLDLSYRVLPPCLILIAIDPHRRRASSDIAPQSNPTTHSDWRTQQGLCRPFLPPRICRQALKVRRGRQPGWCASRHRQQGIVFDHWKRDGLEGGRAEVCSISSVQVILPYHLPYHTSLFPITFPWQKRRR